MAAGIEGGGRVRVDAWTWGVRVFKTRSAAATACRAGHVKVNGERAKPATPVVVGDEVRVRREGVERILVVRRLLAKRASATVAAEACTDLTPPPPPREHVAVAAQRDRGAGRPTKRERREIDRLRGR
ncbi:RNA-binding S4 domain-containing protein [Actinotalea soli]|uniref:RNA-binding S4 domain-containing protein n=1 Tax=Actinotalea soli TaxID=2819234 RepID=UPI0027DBAA84|nr:S4 domain-containing protein [Actinotalea soli]